MNKKEIKSIIGKIEKSREKIKKLSGEMRLLTDDANLSLQNLAKFTCPYKKGQIFKKSGSVIWAKMTGVGCIELKYGPIDDGYISAPYFVECLRCNVKGETQKDKFIIIRGSKIGNEWEVVCPAEK